MFEIVVILLLILINGFFSCAEIAVITARKGDILALSEKGNRNAALLNRLQNNPESFFSIVQIGVTLSGSAAAAVGGISAGELVRPWVQDIPYIGAFSQFVAISIVVLVISYLSLVLGELVPKALALKYPETIALAAARPFHLLGQALRPFVNLLSSSTLFFLKPFGGKIVSRSLASEEEIRRLLREGREKGIFEQTEHDLIQSVFEFTDTSVKEAMVPQPKVHTIPMEIQKEELARLFQEKKFSRYPVYKDNPNDIAGIVLVKDLLGALIEDKPLVLSHFVKPVDFVPETMQVSRLLKEFQRRRTQMAIVVNEYGSVEGLVTMEDLVEEIVGEIQDESDTDEKSVERSKDGSWVVDASLAVRELRNGYNILIPESPDYETVGGYLLAHLQALPKGGEILYDGEYKLTVVDMDCRRINKIKLEKITRKASQTV